MGAVTTCHEVGADEEDTVDAVAAEMVTAMAAVTKKWTPMMAAPTGMETDTGMEAITRLTATKATLAAAAAEVAEVAVAHMDAVRREAVEEAVPIRRSSRNSNQ